MSLLIIRLKVFPDESLASYIYRASSKNLCKIEWLFEPIVLKEKQKYSAVNSGYNKELMSIMATRTGFFGK